LSAWQTQVPCDWVWRECDGYRPWARRFRRRSRFRSAGIHSRGVRPCPAPSADRVAPESSSCTGRSSRATTGARGSAGWLKIFDTSSTRWTYSWSSFGTHHIFCPPTALARGSQIIAVLSRARPWRPDRGAWLHEPSARRSTANDLPGAARMPSPRSQPVAWHQATAPVWAAGSHSARLLTLAPNSASLFVALPADRCPLQPRCRPDSSPDPATPKS
jgi:hypothetical protein